MYTLQKCPRRTSCLSLNSHWRFVIHRQGDYLTSFIIIIVYVTRSTKENFLRSRDYNKKRSLAIFNIQEKQT